MTRDTVDELARAAVLLATFVAICLLVDWTSKAWGGEVTYCRSDPGPGRWIYRVVDGHRCWFEAGGLRRGREKPKEELAWPNYAEPPAMEVPMPPRFPWSEEERFKGDAR